MLEDYVGENVWRQGVRDYIATYSFKNTVSDNLWNAVEHAAGKPVTAIAHDFTFSLAFPLSGWRAQNASMATRRYRLRQEEFSRDNPKKTAVEAGAFR